MRNADFRPEKAPKNLLRIGCVPSCCSTARTLRLLPDGLDCRGVASFDADLQRATRTRMVFHYRPAASVNASVINRSQFESPSAAWTTNK
jgi:hypothetical protein